jgi:hypothetical protein
MGLLQITSKGNTCKLTSALYMLYIEVSMYVHVKLYNCVVIIFVLTNVINTKTTIRPQIPRKEHN